VSVECRVEPFRDEPWTLVAHQACGGRADELNIAIGFALLRQRVSWSGRGDLDSRPTVPRAHRSQAAEQAFRLFPLVGGGVMVSGGSGGWPVLAVATRACRARPVYRMRLVRRSFCHMRGPTSSVGSESTASS